MFENIPISSELKKGVEFHIPTFEKLAEVAQYKAEWDRICFNLAEQIKRLGITKILISGGSRNVVKEALKSAGVVADVVELTAAENWLLYKYPMLAKHIEDLPNADRERKKVIASNPNAEQQLRDNLQKLKDQNVLFLEDFVNQGFKTRIIPQSLSAQNSHYERSEDKLKIQAMALASKNSHSHLISLSTNPGFQEFIRTLAVTESASNRNEYGVVSVENHLTQISDVLQKVYAVLRARPQSTRQNK